MSLGSIPVEQWLASRFFAPWGSDRVAAQYTPDILEQIAAHFPTLENTIKLKVLFSLLGVRKAQLKTCESGLKTVLDRANADEDEWVRLLAEIIGSFPENQTLRIDLSNEHFNELISDINKKRMSPTLSCLSLLVQHSTTTYFPLAAGYLAQPPADQSTPVAHFKLKKTLDPIIAKKAAPTKPTERIYTKNEQKNPVRPPSPLRHPLGRSHEGTGPRLGMLAGMHLPPDKKRKSTAMLEIDDLKEMQAQQKLQEEAKRKKEEDPKFAAAEKMRKQLERQDAIKSRQLERDEKKKKKAEDMAVRKREIEERKAEKDARKSSKGGAPPEPDVVPTMGALSIPPAVASLATSAHRAEFNAMTMLANASEAMRPDLVLPRMHQPFVPASVSLPKTLTAAVPVHTVAPVPAAVAPAVSALLEGNKLSRDDRESLIKFLSGDRTNPSGVPIRQVILNEETKPNPAGGTFLEQIVFEVNYTSGQWKKLRRKLKAADDVTPAATAVVPVPLAVVPPSGDPSAPEQGDKMS